MKILCLPYTHTLSHVSRPLAVALLLRARGHEILFAGEGKGMDFISAQGFKVLPLYETSPNELYGNIRDGKLRFVSEKEVKKLVAKDLTLFREVKPDVVLSDGRFSAPLSTQIFGTKHSAIVNVSSTAYRALPYVPFFDWLPRPLCRKLDRLNLKLEMAVFDNAMRVFKDASRKHATQMEVTATNCLTGVDLTLLADIPEYFPTKNLPSNYHYVGPLTWKSDMGVPSWWPPDHKHGKIAYVSMGTTGMEEFFPKIYSLFEKSQHSAIITTGGQSEKLNNIPGHIYVENFMDGDLAIAFSDIVVCHGGNGTIYQSLMHGKPIIGIPTIPDQKFNMRRVVDLGVGITLSWGDFLSAPSNLLELIDKITLEERFYQNAHKLKEKLEVYDSAKLSADLIQGMFDV